MNRTRSFVLVGLLVALLLGGVVSHYASGDPDGLNKVAEDKGFAATETEHVAADSPFAGYETRGVENERLSGGLAVGTGVVLCFLVGTALTLAVRRRDSAPPAAASSAAASAPSAPSVPGAPPASPAPGSGTRT